VLFRLGVCGSVVVGRAGGRLLLISWTGLYSGSAVSVSWVEGDGGFTTGGV
jgi:hypothetical protein